MDKRKYCFVSNYLTPHQLPFCLAMQKETKDNFIFIETESLPEERIKLGYPNLGEAYSFVLNAKKNSEHFSKALEIARNSDVTIIGSAPDVFIKQRLKENKLTFRFSERIFKKRYHDPLRFAKYFLKNYKYRNKNLFFLLSSAYAPHDYARVGIKEEKMFKWGYFPEVFDIDESLSQEEQNSCIWVGRFLDWKHPEDAVNTVNRLNQEGFSVVLDMVGGGENLEEVKNIVEKKKAKEYVRFDGSQSYEKVGDFLRKAKIFLFTSDYNEGWGAVLNEAMAGGCAIVASHAAGSVPYLIENGKNGLVYEFGNSEQLYAHVKTVLQDNNLALKIAKNARETVKTEWNAQTATKKLINFCNAFFEGDYEKAIPSEGVLSCAKAVRQNKVYKELIKGK